MKVIKKSGFRQIYDISKVKIALQKTAKSINEEFKESDWRELKPRILARLEPIMEGREEIFFWEIDDAVIDSLLRSRFKEIAKEYIQSRSRIRQDKLNDLGLNQLSMWLLKERYLKKDNNGNPIETAREMMCRVSTTIASVEKTQKLKEEYSEKFTKMLCNLEFLPSSPCIVSAGTNKRGTYMSCYAFEICDSLESIFGVLKDSARIFQMGGGVGISVSKLREKGALIKTSNGESSGPVSFLHLFNTMVDTVKAGGFRRGALLALMHYTHPDIEEFIQCKRKTHILTNMNISVMVDDEFFKAVKDNEVIDLKSPKDKKVVKRIPATLLLELITTNIWESGEPGLLFYNRINKDNPTPHLGDLRICNPCLSGDTLIGIVNNYPMKIRDLVGRKKIRVYCSDGHSICERDAYNIKKTGENKNIYKINLNDGSYFKATGNHKILILNELELEYNYKEVNKLIKGDKPFGFRNPYLEIDGVEYCGEEDVYNMTVRDYHNFVIITNVKENTGIVVKNCAEATLLNMEACDLGSINLVKHTKDGEIDWDKLSDTIKLAIRFLDNMIDASPQPTKEIEEAVRKTRKVGLGIMGFADALLLLGIKYSSREAVETAGKIMSFINDVASKYSEELGKEKGLYEAYKEDYRKRRNSIVTTQAPTGSLSLICGVSSGIEPNFAKEYTRVIGNEVVKVSHPSMTNKIFEISNEIPLEQHLNILAEFQKYIENAVSKTCNVPESTTVSDIRNLIIKAWEMDVKGITIFRDHCSREPLIKTSGCAECEIQ